MWHILQAYFASPCRQFQKDFKFCLFYCICNSPVLINFQLSVFDNGLVVRPLDYQSRDLRFKSTMWIHGPLSLSSKVHEKSTKISWRLLWLKVNILLILSFFNPDAFETHLFTGVKVFFFFFNHLPKFLEAVKSRHFTKPFFSHF